MGDDSPVVLGEPMSVNDSITRWKPRLQKLPGFGLARFFYRLLKNVESRNTTLLLLRPPKGLYQPYGTTAHDRYPEIFQFVQTLLGDSSPLCILSIGCSTGEEVFSLRQYFSRAAIKGIDISPFNVAVCRYRRLKIGDKQVQFEVAGSTVGEPSSRYDAVFAMAVFRHGNLNVTPQQPRCDQYIRFADFENSVADIARVLRPGGLLIIQHAMFRFADTETAAQFQPVPGMQADDPGPFYDSNNNILSEARSPETVFRKSL